MAALTISDRDDADPLSDGDHFLVRQPSASSPKTRKVAFSDLQASIGSGDVLGPASAVHSDFAQFNGTSGKLLKDGGLSLDTDATLAADSDSKIASQKAVKTYVDDALLVYVQGPIGGAIDNNFAQFDGNSGELIKDGGLSLDTDGTLAANSDSKIPSQKAVKTYADTKQPALGFTAENVANKDTDGTLASNSDTKYPSQKAVKTYVDANIGGGGTIASTLKVLKGDNSGNAVATDVTDDGAGSLTFRKDQNDYTVLSVKNITDDTSAAAQISLQTGTGTAVFLVIGVDSPSLIGDSGVLVAPGTFIFASHQIAITPTGPTIFSNDGGTTEVARFDQCLQLPPLASAPSSPAEGMIYADTNHHLYYYNGTTWKQLDN